MPNSGKRGQKGGTKTDLLRMHHERGPTRYIAAARKPCSSILVSSRIRLPRCELSSRSTESSASSRSTPGDSPRIPASKSPQVCPRECNHYRASVRSFIRRNRIYANQIFCRRAKYPVRACYGEPKQLKSPVALHRQSSTEWQVGPRLAPVLWSCGDSFLRSGPHGESVCWNTFYMPDLFVRFFSP